MRILVTAKNAFREVLRERILYLVGLYALLLILSLRILPPLSAGAHPKIFLDLALGSMEVLTLLVAAFVSTRSLEKEIQQRTLLVLISKPISRGELLLGKFLGLWGVLLVSLGIMALLMVGIAALGGMSLPLGSLVLSLLFLALKLAILTAVALLFGAFTSSLLAAFFTLGIYLMGNFSQDLLQLGDTLNGEGFQILATILYLILPDFSRLNLKNDAVYGMTTLPDLGNLIFDGIYGVVYAVVVLALAIAIFQRRQL
ncbi:MAG: ABC transporter permease [Phormidium sp. BM_Day4_Bin.17]|nr:ABC transporter permease [Phormidium sp. BM_Day4_Bin.17]UCJ14475.1 MAG: ABC transporter permease [Phormidium sp. PBR-2020]